MFGLQVQDAWFCECDRAYYWAKPAVWKRCGRQYAGVAVLAAIRDMLVPSGDEPTYVLDGWTCDCGRSYERDDGDLLCCGWVLVDEPGKVHTGPVAP